MSDTHADKGTGSGRPGKVTQGPANIGRPRSRSRGSTVLLLVAFVGGIILIDQLRSQFLSDPILKLHPSPAKVSAIQFETESGQKMTLNDFSGQVVLLNIWATWCPPCRDEMPSLDALQRALGGADFEVVAIATDSTGVAAVRPFFERLGIRSLAIHVDRRGAVLPALQIAGLPTTLLIDRDGREIGRSTGPADWSSEGARALVRRHLYSRHAERVQQDLQEEQSIGVSGTPGNILLDHETGSVRAVSGAVPLARLRAEFDKLMSGSE